MVGRFDDYFVRADAIHFVEKSLAFAVQITFNAERGKTIRNNANIPAGTVRAAAVAPVHENFRRRLAFRTGAEGTIFWTGHENAFAQKIGRALSTIRGDDYPAARDGIFTQLRQSKPPRACKRG